LPTPGNGRDADIQLELQFMDLVEEVVAAIDLTL
jgi:hypothetical protein